MYKIELKHGIGQHYSVYLNGKLLHIVYMLHNAKIFIKGVKETILYFDNFASITVMGVN